MTAEQLVCRATENALVRHGGNKAEMCRSLHISGETLRKLLNGQRVKLDTMQFMQLLFEGGCTIQIKNKVDKK